MRLPGCTTCLYTMPAPACRHASPHPPHTLPSTTPPTVREVGDGNINFVYILEGPAGCLCVKQALPYVRIVGESWPLTQVGACGRWQGGGWMATGWVGQQADVCGVPSALLSSSLMLSSSWTLVTLFLCVNLPSKPSPTSPSPLQDRVRVEAAALAEEAAHCPQHVPALYANDQRMCVIAMQASGVQRVGWLAACAAFRALCLWAGCSCCDVVTGVRIPS